MRPSSLTPRGGGVEEAPYESKTYIVLVAGGDSVAVCFGALTAMRR